jgi:hypothetical protein
VARSLSGAHTTALGLNVTRPAWLVDIAFSSVSRFSSYATQTFNGNSYVAADLDVSGLEVEALSVRGSIRIGNLDDAIGALVLAQGVSDRAINVYSYDAAAVATADFQLVAAAVGASASIDNRNVVITLRHKSEQQPAPRAVVSPTFGFNNMLPQGKTLYIAGIAYSFARA